MQTMSRIFSYLYSLLYPSTPISRSLTKAPGFNGGGDPSSFLVCSYNILCQEYISPFHFSNCPSEFKQQGYRHRVLLEELGMLQGDLLGLQEVTPAYYQTLSAALAERGYQGLYAKKSREGKDGVAIFFKSSRFRLLEHSRFELNERTAAICPEAGRWNLLQDTVALFSRLEVGGEEGQPPRELVFGTVHIHYDWKRNDLQALQVALTLQALHAFARGAPQVLTGDFNIQPDGPPYRLLTAGEWDSALWKKGSFKPLPQEQPQPQQKKGKKRLLLPEVLAQHYFRPCRLGSAYAAVYGGQEPWTTNYTSHFTGCLDYIMFEEGAVEPLEVLDLPPEASLRPYSGCPNQRCPSDHLALLARLRLTLPAPEVQ